MGPSKRNVALFSNISAHLIWRPFFDHDALDAWFDRNREQFSKPLDIIYANGDHTLSAMQQPGENWTAKAIEPIFRELMFGEFIDDVI